MKRLVAVITSTLVILSGIVAAASSAPAAGASGWDFSSANFALTSAQGPASTSKATVFVSGLRVTGSSATGYVRVLATVAASPTDAGRTYSCTTQTFTGTTANFPAGGAFNACSGWIAFSVDSSGTLTVSDSFLVVSSDVFAGPGTGTNPGTPYPPLVSCTATLTGATGATLSISDSGTGAASYTITVIGAATSAPIPPVMAPATSSGPVTVAVTGLELGTAYEFTAAPDGVSGTARTCSVKTEAKPAAPVGTATLGGLSGTETATEQEVTLTAPAPPAGWALAWSLTPNGAPVTSPITQACGTSATYYPRLERSDAPSIVGAGVTATASCTLNPPTFVSGTLSGQNATVNYTLNGAALPGTEVWASYRPSGTGPWSDVFLGAPQAGSTSGSGSFTATGLQVPQSAYLKLFLWNGPRKGSPSGPPAVILGEVPPLSYSTIVSGTESGTTARGSAPTVDLSGAIGPTGFRYSAFPRDALPKGLKVDPLTGVVQANGQPLAAFNGAVTIRLWDSFNQRGVDAPVQIQIAPVPPAPDAVTYADVSAVVGSPVTATPKIGSALTGYFYSYALCSKFPGLSLNNRTGVISGTPTLPVAAQKVTITVSKSPGDPCGPPLGSKVTSTNVTVQVSPAPQAFAISYAQSSVTALVGSIIPDDVPTPTPPGQTGLTYAVTAGLLPTGLTLDPATGIISGFATALATGSKVTITATQAQPSRTATTDVTFTILAIPSGGLAGLAYPNVSSAPVGVPMSVVPTGTVTGQTFALDAASLKAGLSIDPATGRITWTPRATQRGVQTVTVTVSSGGTSAALAPFTITVVAASATTQQSGSSSANQPSSAAGAATGGAGGSSGSSGAAGAQSACLAPTGTIYADVHGSVGSTLTMAPNTIGMPTPTSFVVTKGSLPVGVWLDGNAGVISGTPTRSNGGNGAVEITTTWADGTQRASDFNIGIDDPHHAVNYPNRIIGSIGQATSVTPLPINAVGAKRFELVCGTLPAGTSMNPRTGVISGTPTTLDERPMPLRVRMTDAYGWVDASLIFVVNNGVTPWMRYPEFAEIGAGRAVRIVPTRSGLAPASSYALVGKLPKGLTLNKKTGVISGRSVVVNHLVYEPTVTAFGPDGKPQASTVPSIAVIKPAVPMKVTARFANRAVPKGTTVVVTKVKHPAYVSLTANVTCKGCTYTFNKRTGRLVVKATKAGSTVKVNIIGQPKTRATRIAYAGHTWTRSWHVHR